MTPMCKPIFCQKNGMDINAGNWVDSSQDRDYWRAPVNAGSINHES